MNTGSIKFGVKLINISSITQHSHLYKVYLFHSSTNVNSTILPRTRKVVGNPFEVSNRIKVLQKKGIGLSGYILLSFPVITFILGTWQIKRLMWKVNLINELKTRTSSEPRMLPTNLHELESMEYCPVKVTGKYLLEKEFAVCPKSLIINGAGAFEGKTGIFSHAGTSGCYIITPFQLQDRNLTILVNRGWVPNRRKDPSTRTSSQIQDVVEITGIVRLNEKKPPLSMTNDPVNNVWLYRDLDTMAKVHGTAPVYIDLIAKDTVPGGPIGGQTRVTLRNEHLGYIITWYAISAFSGIWWYKQFIKKVPL